MGRSLTSRSPGVSLMKGGAEQEAERNFLLLNGCLPDCSRVFRRAVGRLLSRSVTAITSVDHQSLFGALFLGKGGENEKDFRECVDRSLSFWSHRFPSSFERG